MIVPSQHVYFWQGQFWNLGRAEKSTQVILNMHMEKSCKKRNSHFNLIFKRIKKINTWLRLDALCLIQLDDVNSRVLYAIWKAFTGSTSTLFSFISIKIDPFFMVRTGTPASVSHNYWRKSFGSSKILPLVIWSISTGRHVQ